MRKGQKGGLCATCGKESDEGLFWGNAAIVLDFGVKGVAPLEPDMSQPVRCDDCEQQHNEADPLYRMFTGMPPLGRDQ